MPSPRRVPHRVHRLAAVATVVTSAVVAMGVLTGGVPTAPAAVAPAVDRASLGSVTMVEVAELRTQRLSRTAGRVTLEPRAVGHRYAEAGIALRDAADGDAPRSGWLRKSTRVAVTGQVIGPWAEVLIDGQPRWVIAERLATTKPRPKPKVQPKPEAESGSGSAGLSSAPCAAGSSIESGLTSAATALYRAVCAAFPQPRSYGGYDAHGEHVDGRAIDIMVSGALGQQIADWLRANAGALRVRTVIYAQRIWTPERGGEGWRWMSDRGSSTANHYDHVHVSVY